MAYPEIAHGESHQERARDAGDASVSRLWLSHYHPVSLREHVVSIAVGLLLLMLPILLVLGLLRM